jgi:hypothetical protein
VQANGTYSFAVVSNSTDAVIFNAKESATNRPQLVVQYAASSAPASTPTPLPTTGTSDPGAIFGDGLESGDFRAWGLLADNEADLSVSAGAALAGARGVSALIDNNTSMYLGDFTPNGEARYLASFRFDPNGVVMADGNVHRIFAARNAAADLAYVELGFAATTGYRVRAAVRRDAGTYAVSGWFNLADAPAQIALDWRAATAAGANNGALTLSLNGAPLQTLAAVDNDTLRVEEARLGPQQGIDTGTRGTTYFDDFVSRRS